MSAVNLVVDNVGALTTAATWIQSHLTSLGHTVTLVQDSAAEVTTGDLVFIGPGVNATDIGDKYRDSMLPVVASFASGWDNLLLATGASASSASSTNVAILPANAGHPLAAGQIGTIAIQTTSGGINYRADTSFPASGVQVANVNTATRPCLVGFETGAARTDASECPNRRVCLGYMAFQYHDGTNPNLTANGIALLDAAVAWALAGEPLAPPQRLVDFTLDGTTWQSGVLEVL